MTGPQSPSRKSRPSLIFLVLFLITICFANGSEVNGKDLYRFRPGLVVSKERPLKNSHLQTLLQGLKNCTGLEDLHIDDTGRVVLGDRASLTPGSIRARELLIAVIESRDSFILENGNHSPEIAFAEIESTDTYIDEENQRHAVWRIRLDFSDFSNLRGPKQVVASFAPEFVLLHELAHGVWRKSDALSEFDQLGECERYLNQIRRELGLPERESYRPRGWRAVSPGNSAESLQAEFRFSMITDNNKKPLFLVFDVDRVCDVSRIQSLPAGRAEIFIAIRSVP